jgi:hypothetical protein
MRLVFEPYVRDFMNGKEQDFKEMLRDQHRILTAGIDGTNRYWGASLGVLNYLMGASAIPGIYRYEDINGPPSPRMILKISIAEKLQGQVPVKTSFIQRNPIQGISEKNTPLQMISAKNILFIYPKNDGVVEYLASMQNDMIRALRMIRAGKPRDEVLPLLADYVQKGVAGHVFGLANYSLYMTQVNSLLIRMGFAGISPGNLDYHALVEDTATFEQRFIDEVHRLRN